MRMSNEHSTKKLWNLRVIQSKMTIEYYEREYKYTHPRAYTQNTPVKLPHGGHVRVRTISSAFMSSTHYNTTQYSTIYCVTQTSAFHFSKVLFDVLVWRIGFSLHTCLHNSPKTYNVKKNLSITIWASMIPEEQVLQSNFLYELFRDSSETGRSK